MDTKQIRDEIDATAARLGALKQKSNAMTPGEVARILQRKNLLQFGSRRMRRGSMRPRRYWPDGTLMGKTSRTRMCPRNVSRHKQNYIGIGLRGVTMDETRARRNWRESAVMIRTGLSRATVRTMSDAGIDLLLAAEI